MREFVGVIPPRISKLPRDRRGFPVPFFVQWIDGEPHFPIMSPVAFKQCVEFKKCWCCGQPLGAHMAFCIGPMCLVNRLSAEPPSHYDCALFAALNCPFLAHPKLERSLKGEEADRIGAGSAGIMLDRNPGVSAIWTTKSYKIERDGNKGYLFRIGPAERISFWARSREATRDEVMHSVETGLPILREMSKQDDLHNGNNTASKACERMIAAGLALIDSTFEEAVK